MTIRTLSLLLFLLLAACGANTEAPGTAPTALEPAVGSEQAATVQSPEAAFEADTGVYRCPGQDGDEAISVVTRTVPDGLGVFLPPTLAAESYQVLTEQQPGVYRNETLSVSGGGDEITLQSDASAWGPCRRDHRASIWEHAKLNGVNFRATGNEPGWVLEIRHRDSIDLRYDYGAGRLKLPVIEERPDVAARETRILAGEGAEQLVVLLRGETCQDTMADERFPTRVVIEFDGRRLEGCGRPLH